MKTMAPVEMAKKVRPILPAGPILPEQAKAGFVTNSVLKAVALGLPAKSTLRQSPSFGVDQRSKFLAGDWIALAPTLQKSCNSSGRNVYKSW